jgi:hypothetical protein
MTHCPECGAQFASADDSCARRFEGLLALDHSRQEPWSSRHGIAFAAFVLQHPGRYPHSVDAAWDILYRVYCLNEPAAMVLDNRRRNSMAAPRTSHLQTPPTWFTVTIVDLGDFASDTYPELLDFWCRSTLTAWGASVAAPDA